MFARLLWLLVIAGVNSQVRELDDSFVEKRGDEPWLVEFYAPWCGHCKKLEPAYHQVALDLKDSGVFVGRVDATRFSVLAHEHSIHGFPTIIFLEGQQSFLYHGDRSKESIIEFAMRAKKPRLHPISTRDEFKSVLAKHRTGVFVKYVGKEDVEEPLWLEYAKLADNSAILSYFYYGPSSVLPNDVDIQKKPTVLIFKDNYHVEFEESDTSLLERWFTNERFPDFPRISGPGLNEMSNMDRLLVIVVTDEMKGDHKAQDKFKQLVKDHLNVYKPAYRSKLQFLWMSENSHMRRLTRGQVETPGLVVLNTSTQEYFLPTMSCADMESVQLGNFLAEIIAGTLTPVGGTGFIHGLALLKYDILTMIVSMFTESPLLALVIFGLPTLVIALLIYLMCIMNLDQEEEMPNLEGLTDEQRQLILYQRVSTGDEEAVSKLLEYGDITETEAQNYLDAMDEGGDEDIVREVGQGDGPRLRGKTKTKKSTVKK